MNTRGRIDTHSHILPGIDDGCPDLADSLTCVRQFIAAGYAGTICTPHILPRTFPLNTPTRIREWVAALQEAVNGAGLHYQLWAGGEVTLAPDNWKTFEQHGVPTLGASNAVLVDYWGDSWPAFADDVINRLQAEGYQPILAHPERMKLPVKDLEQLVATLSARGVWLQGNLNCLSGGEGDQAQWLSQTWLKAGLYDLLASDTHHSQRMTGRLVGLQTAIELVGASRVAELTIERTGKIATG